MIAAHVVWGAALGAVEHELTGRDGAKVRRRAGAE